MSESAASVPEGMHRPYPDRTHNFLYNLLFCDDPSLFAGAKQSAQGAWPILFAKTPDPTALRAVANDETADSRMRALAFNRLRHLGHEVTSKLLLGVIVEVPLELGMDTLAAYRDGGVRYLNQGGKLVIIEGEDTRLVGDMVRQLIDAGQEIVNAIGPISGARKPPPAAGHLRVTFLVSDGLYTGEGPFSAFQRDTLSGPVVACAAQLLRKVIELATDHQSNATTSP